MAARLIGWISSWYAPTPPNAELSKDLIDSVTFEPMTKAVTLIKCGHNFNENTAKTLMDRNFSCPLDRRPIESYVPNINLRNIVDAALQQLPRPLAQPPEDDAPAAAVAHFEKGKQLFADHQYEQAVNAFLAALILHPTYEKAQAFLESSLEAQKRNPTTVTASAAASSVTSAPSSYPSTAIPKQSATTINSSAPKQQEKASFPLPSYVTEALNRAGRGRALIKAVDEENIQVIRYLLGQDTQVDSKDGQNRTPLLVACQKRNEGIIRLLIGNGAPVDGDDARAALIEATEKGHREVVKILVNEGVPMMNKMGPRAGKILSDSYTPCIPLEIVAKNGDVELLNFFLDTRDRPNGVKLDTTSSYQTSVIEQALMTALENGKSQIALRLMEITDVNVFLRKDLLHKVCNTADLKLLRCLLAKGIHITQPISIMAYGDDYKFGQRCLLIACSQGDKEFVTLLLQKGVDLDTYTTHMGYGSGHTLRYDALQQCSSNHALAEFIRTFRCNGRDPIPMQTKSLVSPC